AFHVTANNVTIQGLNLTGPTDNRFDAGTDCNGTNAFRSNSVNHLNILNNTITGFECGIVLETTDAFTVNNNVLTNMGYSGITTYPSSNGALDGNFITDVNTAGTLGDLAYGITITGPAGSPSSNITLTHNAVFNVPTWECFDNHGGSNISWKFNYCLAGGLG